MRGVYAIADIDTLDRKGVDPGAFAEAVLEGGVCALQLRAKAAGRERLKELARSLGARAAAAGVPFFVNDAVEIAIEGRHAGVHLGQHDVAPAAARRLAERRGHELAIGLSTHSERELAAALTQPIAYVAIGPVFATSSKEKPEPVLGVELARALGEQARRSRPELPVVAIGGIDEQGAASLRGAVDAVAVIGALLPGHAPAAAAITRRVRVLREAFEGPSA